MPNLIAQNVNTILFVAGFVLVYLGVAELSRAVANIVAGVVMMGLAAMPYLAHYRKGIPRT